MRLLLATVLCLAASALAISVPPQQPIRAKLLIPQGFKPAPAQDRNEEPVEFVQTAATQVRRPLFGDENYPVQNQNAIPVVPVRPHIRPQAHGLRRVPLHQQQQQQQQLRQAEENAAQQTRPVSRTISAGFPGLRIRTQQAQANPPQFKTAASQVEEKVEKERSEEEEEEKEEEPDRLSILLPQSKFECVGKSTGYYADENLGCEVFHYCQDNAKHSWICPNGFTFHQVHLICMPPGADNICEKSSQFHFVNEYLYKPVNLEEHQNKPNVSLKYSDRYYPDQYYPNNEEEGEYEEQEGQAKKVPVRVQQAQQQVQPQIQQTRRPTLASPFGALTFKSDTNGPIFRSAEEVNIPLQQRRPQFRYSGRDDHDFKK